MKMHKPLIILCSQTTNLLLQAGEEALHTDPDNIARLRPLM
jgi:hypothetical protein